MSRPAADPTRSTTPSARASTDVAGRDDAERSITLTDGVVAIALTLLALDLKPSLARTADSHQLAHYLHEHAAEYGAFGIAFALIGQYWLTHHRLMREVQHTSRALLILTFGFLFGITLAPLTTYLTGEYSNPLATTLFAADIIVISTALALMGEHIRRHGLDDAMETTEQRLVRRTRAGMTLLVPVLVIAGAWMIGGQAEWLYLLFFVAGEPGELLRRRVMRRAR